MLLQLVLPAVHRDCVCKSRHCLTIALGKLQVFAVALLSLQIITIAFAVCGQFIAITFGDSRKENIAVAFANYAMSSRSPLRVCKTIAITFAIRGRFLVFALASTWRCHIRNCKSVEGITIAQAIRGREKTLQSASFAVSLRLL